MTLINNELLDYPETINDTIFQNDTEELDESENVSKNNTKMRNLQDSHIRNILNLNEDMNQDLYDDSSEEQDDGDIDMFNRNNKRKKKPPVQNKDFYHD